MLFYVFYYLVLRKETYYVSNRMYLIAGLILAFERPIQKGDTIEIGTLMGDVTGIGVRASTVRTYDGSEVIVPNGNLISNEVINWTLSDPITRLVLYSTNQSSLKSSSKRLYSGSALSNSRPASISLSTCSSLREKLVGIRLKNFRL